MSRTRAILAILAVALAIGREAAASDDLCPATERPRVAARLARLPPGMAREVIDHLRSALDIRGIDLCASEAPAHVTSLEIEPASPDGIFRMEVEDAVTDKRVARDVDLRTVPADARPLAVAQSADELLRAAWAELLIPDRPARPAPKELVAAVAGPAKAERAVPLGAPVSTFGLGVGIGAEVFSKGHAQLGPDLSLEYFPWRPVGAVVRVGVRTAIPVRSELGVVEASGALGSFELSVRHAFIGRVTVAAGPCLLVSRLVFDGRPAPGFDATSADAVAMFATARGRATIALGQHLHAGASLELGAPIRSARVIGDGAVLHEVGGVLAGAQLTTGLAW